MCTVCDDYGGYYTRLSGQDTIEQYTNSQDSVKVTIMVDFSHIFFFRTNIEYEVIAY